MNKSFLRGVGSVIDLFPQDRKIQLPLPSHTDGEAFRKDLEVVGSDMYHAIHIIEQSEKEILNTKNEKRISGIS